MVSPTYGSFPPFAYPIVQPLADVTCPPVPNYRTDEGGGHGVLPNAVVRPPLLPLERRGAEMTRRAVRAGQPEAAAT
jgi:hypothetical protein